MERSYFHECDEVDVPMIRAGIANGSIRKWRKDSEGNQWFKRIDGIPGDPATAEDFESEISGDDDDDVDLSKLSNDELFAQLREYDPNFSLEDLDCE